MSFWHPVACFYAYKLFFNFNSKILMCNSIKQTREMDGQLRKRERESSQFKFLAKQINMHQIYIYNIFFFYFVSQIKIFNISFLLSEYNTIGIIMCLCVCLYSSTRKPNGYIEHSILIELFNFSQITI